MSALGTAVAGAIIGIKKEGVSSSKKKLNALTEQVKALNPLLMKGLAFTHGSNKATLEKDVQKLDKTLGVKKVGEVGKEDGKD